MVTESEIIREIEGKVTHYSVWTIGITDDPNRRRAEHGNPQTWYHWNAVSESSARRIEKYFLDKGMKGAPGGGISPNYVYIFI